MKKTVTLLFLGAAFVFAGCSSLTIDKSTLKKEGILVGKTIPMSSITIEPGIKLNADSNGYFAAALKPGKYAIKNIQVFADVKLYAASYVQYFDNYGMNLSLDVKPGAITDVGLIYIVNSKPSKKFWVYRFNIKENLSAYLRATYPEAFTNNKNPPYFLSGRFVPPDKVNVVRAFIFNKALVNPIVNNKISKSTLFAGPAGLIATYNIRNYKIVDLKIMNNSSFGTAECEPSGTRSGYCLIADPFMKARFAAVTGDKMSVRDLPYNVDNHTHFKITRDGEVFVADLRMQIHWSTDGGKTWHTDVSAKTPAPDEGSLNAHDLIEIYEGKRGVYVCGSPLEKYILFKANGSDHFVKIPTPADHIVQVVETRSGILVWRNGDLLHNDKMYFTSDNGSSYRELPTPGQGYCSADVADYKNSILRFSCGILKKSIYEGSVIGGKWALQQ